MASLNLGATVQSGLADAMAQSEDVSTIINIAATAEAMAVTLLGAAIAGAAGYDNADGSKGLAAPLVSILKAAQSAEQAHYAYLTGAGAKPLTTTFNIPDPKIASDTTTLFKTIEALETAFISAYEAAAMEFAAMMKPDLVKVALQVGAVEAEHRALARLALGDALPHNVAFEAAQFATVGDAANALKQLGFIGGTGTAVSYGDYAGKVDNSGMTELTPSGPSANAGTAPSSVATPAPSTTTAQIPSQMPTTGGGGMAGSGFTLWPVVAAAAGGLILVGTGLRNRRSAREQ